MPDLLGERIKFVLAPTVSSQHLAYAMKIRSATAQILQRLFFGVHCSYCVIELWIAGPTAGSYNNRIFIRRYDGLCCSAIFRVQCRVRGEPLKDERSVDQGSTSETRVGSVGLDMNRVHDKFEPIAQVGLCGRPLSSRIG